MRLTAAVWLLALLSTLSRAAKLPLKDGVQDMETGLELHGSSHRDKRGTKIEDLLRFESASIL